MPVVARELAASRQEQTDGRNPRAVFRYLIYGSEGNADVRAAVSQFAPLSYSGLPRLESDLRPVGGGVWEAELVFGVPQGAPGVAGRPGQQPQPAEPLQEGWQFDTSGGTAKVTQSKRTRSKALDQNVFAPGLQEAPDFNKAIGVGPDGEVAGCDVVSTSLRLTRTKEFPDLSVGYIAVAAALTGRVNSGPLWTAEPGELLFLGASGQRQGPGKWSVSFTFAWSKNRVDEEVCPGLVVPLVGGHDHLWVVYGPAVTNGRRVTRPLAAYVEQVYAEGDFGLLGL